MADAAGNISCQEWRGNCEGTETRWGWGGDCKMIRKEWNGERVGYYNNFKKIFLLDFKTFS